MESKAYFSLSQRYSITKQEREVLLKISIKKSQSMRHSNFSKEPNEVVSQDISTYKRHLPRSVCDTERDRRLHRDPLKEEELK